MTPVTPLNISDRFWNHLNDAFGGWSAFTERCPAAYRFLAVVDGDYPGYTMHRMIFSEGLNPTADDILKRMSVKSDSFLSFLTALADTCSATNHPYTRVPIEAVENCLEYITYESQENQLCQL